jgi:hypothetical protein
MFVQIIQGKAQDADLIERQVARWQEEIKPGATGYQGMTGGVTPDGRSISLVRFESEEAAQANSSRAEQAAWWNEMAKAYDGDPTFYNCSEVDHILGGGSNQAGFVQIIQGRAKDQAAMRAMGDRAETELKAARPDILGITVAWHGDGGFTQAVYFKSEADARAAETSSQDDEMGQQYMDLMEGEPTFFDLPNPMLD